MWGDISFCFWLAFLWWLTVLSIFSFACWASECLLWKTSIQFCPFLNWIFLMLVWCWFWFWCWCMSCLYILDSNPLTVISFVSIFSHSVSFHFVDGFLYCIKLLSLNRSQLFIFAFVSFLLGDRSKKPTGMIYVSVLPIYNAFFSIWKGFLSTNLYLSGVFTKDSMLHS